MPNGTPYSLKNVLSSAKPAGAKWAVPFFAQPGDSVPTSVAYYRTKRDAEQDQNGERAIAIRSN